MRAAATGDSPHHRNLTGRRTGQRLYDLYLTSPDHRSSPNDLIHVEIYDAYETVFTRDPTTFHAPLVRRR